MKKILVIYAHPNADNSRMNKALIQHISNQENITISNLYQKYPNAIINIKEEQYLIESHDLLVWQFPFYWFNTTPLLKQWIDEVLLEGFAYGARGNALRGKDLLIATTIGGTKERYLHEPHFSLPELLKPFEYTAKYCNMVYRKPFILADPEYNDEYLFEQGKQYLKLFKEYIQEGSFAFSRSYPSFQ